MQSNKNAGISGNSPFRRQLTSSSAGALATCLCMTPLDVVKVRLQIQPKIGQKFYYCNGLMDCLCVGVNGQRHKESMADYYRRCWMRRPMQVEYRNGLDAAIKIMRTEGIRSLWSGLGPTIGLSAFSVCMYFTLYEYLRENFKARSRSETVKSYVAVPLAGTAARVTTIIFITPGEVIRTRLQADSRLTFSKAVKSICKQRKFYAGFSQTLLRDVPFSAIYWMLNEQIRNNYLADLNMGTFTRNFAGGFLAGSVAAVATHPFDVLKTRQQTSNSTSKFDPVLSNSNSSFRSMIQNEGWKSLYAGVSERTIRTSFACAIMLGSYELAKQWFD